MKQSITIKPTALEPLNNETSIFFHTESPLAFELSSTKENNYREWLHQVVIEEGYELTELNYIFCSDAYLHKMNVEYLNHDTLTDVIPFHHSDAPCCIEGDIFLRVPRLDETAQKFGVLFLEELKRVMVHGLLHLLGYADKTETEQTQMTGKENFYLKKEVRDESNWSIMPDY